MNYRRAGAASRASERAVATAPDKFANVDFAYELWSNEMSEVQLLSLAAQKIDWLSMRQSILAQNVANVNTPKYRAMDVVPFESFLDNSQLAMTVSNERHIDASQGEPGRLRTQQDRTGDTNFSGNNVSLENEFLKLGETRGQFALSTGLIKSFNRMIMASLKA